MTSLRGQVDDVKIEADNQGATVLVENEGAIVLARIDAETSKTALEDALLETNEQLRLASYYRSSPAGSLEEARKLRADGGRVRCSNCGAWLPAEIDEGTGVYCSDCGHGQHVTDGGRP